MRVHYLKKILFVFLLSAGVGLIQPGPLAAYEVNKSAIVLLVSHGSDGQAMGTGSGFIVKPEGVLITNYHVLVGAHSVTAIFHDGRQVPIQGILNVNRAQDFSILKLTGDAFSTLELGNSDLLKPYDYSSALGYPSQTVQTQPEGLRGAILQTFGFVLGVHSQAYPEYSFIYTTTPFSPGFSGGPLVNRENKVIGLATLEGRSINLALPINYLKPHLHGTALMSFEQLLAEDKNSKEAYYYQGNFKLYALGEVDRAIQLYQKALQIDSNYALAHYDLAVAYRGMGEVDRAIAEYQKTLSIHPNFPEALSNLGGQYFRKGEIEKAIAQFQKALTLYPNFIQALSNMGAALNKQGNPQGALPHLKKALGLDPEFALAHFNLGNTLFALGHWSQAEESYNQAIRMGIDFLSLHWQLYEIHKRQGRPGEAAQELKIILEIDPENLQARALQKSLLDK
ncbi:MAG: tetratricopeptide repeat protein [Nitrospina sp.]|nr:MAG: tetratricopeptide repeat protein [Nitrospina sp.]